MLDRLLARLKRTDWRRAGLETCALCGRDFVNPVDWEPLGPDHWWILLRCGECEVFAEVTVPNEMAADYEVELGRRASLLERLDRQRMAAEVEAMIVALRRGRVCAADFT